MRPPQYKHHLPSFIEALQAKLQDGHDRYGDNSFNGPASDTIAELQQECLDLAGWGMILWVKLERMRERSEGLANELPGLQEQGRNTNGAH